jgi:hypothetical protein
MTLGPQHRAFHAHLDVCAQCRENPIGMCVTGRELLREAVDSTAADLPACPPHTWARRRYGRQCADCGLAERGVDVDGTRL